MSKELVDQRPHRPFAKGTVCREESLTRQSEKDDADINTILRRYEATGVLPIDTRSALFLDVSQVGSFQDIRNHQILAQDAFMQLPAQVRREFGDDVNVFLDESVDPEKRAKFQALGLLEKDPTPGEAARAAIEAAEKPPEPAKPA